MTLKGNHDLYRSFHDDGRGIQVKKQKGNDSVLQKQMKVNYVTMYTKRIGLLLKWKEMT